MGQAQLEAAQGLVAVGAGEVEDEGAVVAGHRFGHPGLEGRGEGAGYSLR